MPSQSRSQPLAPAAARRQTARRGSAQEHSDDRADGVGKTEISRRLAKLAGAPFLKVEATKFTEVGYVGRDVEQIVRDLVEIGIAQTREKKRKDVRTRAEQAAEDRVVDALVGPGAGAATKDSFRRKLRSGELDDKEIEIEVQAAAGGMPMFEIPGMRAHRSAPFRLATYSARWAAAVRRRARSPCATRTKFS